MGRRIRRILRASRTLALLVLAVIVAFLAWERLTFDRAAWIADYEQLRRHVSSVYANFTWALQARAIDPVALDRETRRRLAEASTDRQARAAIEAFVGAFDDGHFTIRRVKLSKRIAALWADLWRREDAAMTLRADTDAETACDALGFSGDAGELRFGLASVPGFSAVGPADGAFPAGVLAIGDRRVGVLRIHAFDQHRYHGACVRAWERMRATIADTCDEACVDRFVHQAAADQLLAELADQARALAAAGVDLLVVDVTRNGGGTDWVDPAARILTTKPLRCPRLAFIRHPHWSERLRRLLVEVEEDLAAAPAGVDHDLLKEARSRLQGLVREAEAPCDLAAIWDGAPLPSCSQLVEGEYSACGVFADLPPDSLRGARSREALFKALGYAYEPGVYAGRLALLTDRWTASAAEHFAATLRDNDAAVLVGERTHGSGCGYTSGGVPAILEHSGLRVHMPDCQRRRRGGENELAGIAPDVVIDWDDGDDEDTRRGQLLAALAALAGPGEPPR